MHFTMYLWHNLLHGQNLNIDNPSFVSRGQLVYSGTKKEQAGRRFRAKRNIHAHWFEWHKLQQSLKQMWASMIDMAWQICKHTMSLRCSPQAQLRMPKHLQHVHSFPSEALTHMFTNFASRATHTVRSGLFDFLGLRECTSSERITLCYDLATNHEFHNLRCNIH